ncbi:MAG TPA: DUF1015 domain-containing protein [Aeromicrobium sp.]|nr:DUF1015 domain-containing protein [Aeromicrobium sp.]
MSHGLVLKPFRALRFVADGDRLSRLLCPPYDVISPAERAALLAGDPDNAVSLVLPDSYPDASERIARHLAGGTMATDPEPALYVYEMAPSDAPATRGLIGAVELRAYADGVILPHENTMAGPVADRLALMDATDANLEAIYLVYDGGGAATEATSDVPDSTLVASATTPDGTTHRLWALTDPGTLAAIDADLAGRTAMIADGHHRYATYLELQAQRRAVRGAGPWDFGLALLVDSSSYGPQVHAIHRVLVGLALDDALAGVASRCTVDDRDSVERAVAALDAHPGFACVLTDGKRSVVVHSIDADLLATASSPDDPGELAVLDVTVLHRALVPHAWGLPDTVDAVGYAHDIDEAIAAAQASGGTAVLMRPTPVSAVVAVARAGGRMPRKSTLFTPKPASGLVLRRFADA